MSGVKGGIRGAQIKDDSLTGADINEGTLILPQSYHSSGNHDSINAIEYLALPGRNGWTTTFLKREMQLIAPYDGSVTKLFLRPTTGDNTNATDFQVRTNGNGYEAKNGATNVVTTTNLITAGISEGTTELVLETPAPIPKGHAFSFGLLKMAGSGYGITDAVIVIEWDLSS
jgi:hypothetical protein